MRKLLLSVAAGALLAGGAPALAKKGGHGHGAHKAQKYKAQKHRGMDERRDRDDRRFDRYDDERYAEERFGERRFAERGRGCPPGLAKKNNGCLPPGQARKLGVGDRIPDRLDDYNLPQRYRERYRDNGDHAYRYEDEQIYRVNRRSGIIDQIISVLGF